MMMYTGVPDPLEIRGPLIFLRLYLPLPRRAEFGYLMAVRFLRSIIVAIADDV